MLNNREEDKFENTEEGEYHFSDDEVSYEVEAEPAKPVAESAPKEAGGSPLARLTRSKRLLISLGIFLVLVFIVYKMVVPSSTSNQSTAIIPEQATPVVAQQTPTTETQSTAPMQIGGTPTAPVLSNAPVAPAQPIAPAQPPQQIVTAPVAQPVTTTQTMNPPVATMQQPMASSPPVATMQPPMQPVMSAQPVAQTTTQPTYAQPVPQQQMQPVDAQQLQTLQQDAMATMNSLPTVIPVQSNVTANMQQQQPVTQTVTTTTHADQLLMQLTLEYNKKLAEFAEQNKTLQTQMHTLSSRVETMEGQLNQLIEELSRANVNRNAPAQQAPATAIPAAQAPAAAAPMPVSSNTTTDRVSGYMVQAIIPGRAWLRSVNGETVTVAEGDRIKGVGRVAKIDPYNGNIEINTGTKTVTLSYGTSG